MSGIEKKTWELLHGAYLDDNDVKPQKRQDKIRRKEIKEQRLLMGFMHILILSVSLPMTIVGLIQSDIDGFVCGVAVTFIVVTRWWGGVE